VGPIRTPRWSSACRRGHAFSLHFSCAEARQNLTALKAMWACNHTEVLDYAAQLGQDGIAEAMQKVLADKHSRLVLHVQGTNWPSRVMHAFV
jgi:hypothetical protein